MSDVEWSDEEIMNSPEQECSSDRESGLEMDSEDKRDLEEKHEQEKEELERKFKEEYDHMLEIKNEVIRTLIKERDNLQREMKDLKEALSFKNEIISDGAVAPELEWDPMDGLGNRRAKPTTEQDSTQTSKAVTVNEAELIEKFQVQKEFLVRVFRYEKLQMEKRFEQEKADLEENLRRDYETRHAREVFMLQDIISELEEGLHRLKEQKDEVKKIFDGEKQAIELSFERREAEIRKEMKLEVQKKLIQAHREWANSQI